MYTLPAGTACHFEYTLGITKLLSQDHTADKSSDKHSNECRPAICIDPCDCSHADTYELYEATCNNCYVTHVILPMGCLAHSSVCDQDDSRLCHYKRPNTYRPTNYPRQA